MSRRTVIGLACAASALFFAAALVAVVEIARALAFEEQVDSLELLNHSIIERTNLAYTSAIATLSGLEASPLPRCSEEHIAAMRQATANNRYVAGMGVFEGNVLRCSAWGMAKEKIPRVAPDFITREGIQVTLNLRPQMSRSAPRISLNRNDYFVLVDPAVLLDSLTDPNNRFAVATESGFLLATRNDPDRQLLQLLIANPHDGVNDELLYAATREKGLIAIAMKPRRYLSESFGRQAVFLLPICLFVALLLVGAVAWKAHRRLSRVGELQAAVRRLDFVAYYQPIIELQTGRCVGAEALVRWRRPDDSLVPPDDFIPLAEQSGLIVPITDQMVDCVIRDLRSLLEGDPCCHIAINLSAGDVATGRALDVIQRELASTGIRNNQIWLEVTESGFVEIDAATVTLQRAHRLGHKVAIDDFGTGYSCLRSLQDLPLDALKIDKSFVDTIGRDTVHSSVTPLIIDMARKLGLACIAEGIETQAQLDYLTAQGVAYGQGWLFSRPLCAGDFIAFHQRCKSPPSPSSSP